MKINTNVEGPAAGRVHGQSANAVPKEAGRTNTETVKPSHSTQNLAQKRSIVDAVIVNQIAQEFLQKAVLIASKLRSLASEAISTGKINNNELNETLKNLSSMNNIQDGFDAAVTVQNNATASRAGLITETPKIKEDIKALNGFADEISAGDLNLKKIDRINESLTNKALIVDKSLNQLINKLSIPDNIAEGSVKYSEYTQSTVSNISKYPQAALKSQGNINYEAVGNLL